MQSSEVYDLTDVCFNNSNGLILPNIVTYPDPNTSRNYDVIEPRSTDWSLLQNDDVQEYVKAILGPKWKDDCYIILTMVYVIMFLTGLVGNLLTCLVIVKNAFMHTVTNLYLLSLASADLLILVLGKYT